MSVLPRGRMPLGPKAGLERGEVVALTIDGEAVTAHTGETIAAVLVARDGTMTRRTAGGAARGFFCGMGGCFDCLVVVDGVPNVRACVTLVAAGLRVSRQQGPGLSD